MSGSQVQSYDLLERIGEGSFGEVYLALDRKRDRKVALKFLRLDPDSPRFADAVALFKREFELLRELKHPHLASVSDFGFDAERRQYFFSAEYCAGQNLLDSFSGRPLEFFEDALVQILSALDYIHSQGVIHSDIKPENVMVEVREGMPVTKLLDFGVAGRMGRQGVGGSPAYMAPELLGPNPRFEPRADLYSLGMLALEMLTGQLPFPRENARAATEWQLRGKIPESAWRAREIPAYLRELTEKLLKKNPSERFSNARVVLNFLNLGTSGRYQTVEAGLRAELPLEGPLVERREEVLEGLQKQLVSFFRAGGSDAAMTVRFLWGERGIGKSRLVEELRQFLAVQEIRSVGLTGDWELPSWPRLAEALNLPVFSHDNPDRDWQIRRRVDALREAAKQSPLCLLIDDFHKVDPDLRETILKLFELTQSESSQTSAPLFVVATSEAEISGGTELKRLSAQGVLQYVQQIMGREDRTVGLAEVLFRYSGGLPLLVAEGLRYLAPRFHRGEPLEAVLPSSQIAALYEEKIQSLSAPEERLLHLIALLYRPVEETELMAILGLSAPELGDLAKHALRLGLLGSRTIEKGENEFSINYQVNSQALAASLIERLDPDRRRALHLVIAEGMKQSGAPLEELAYHVAKSGQAEEAAQVYEKAANAQRAAGQISSAARCFAKSIEMTPVGSDHWQDLVTELARLFILSGSYREAEETLKKLEPYPSWKGEELRGWLAFKKREFPSAREHYENALGALAENQLAQRILVENALANTDLQDGKAGEAALRFQKTLEWERTLPPEEQCKISNNNLGIALVLKGDEPGAVEFYSERVRRLNGLLKPEEEIALLNGRSYVFLQTGHYEDTISCLKKAMHLAEQSGALHPLSSIMGNLITALIKESRYAESLPLLQKIVAYQERLGSHRDVAYNLLRQGSVYLTLGMGEKAKTCFQSGRSFSGHSDRNLTLWYLLVEGYWEREHGSLERAWDSFRALETEAESLRLPEIHAWAVYAQADLAYEQKNMAECRKLLSKIRVATQDREFLARLHLLEAKLSAYEKGENAEQLFANVESECLQGHYREILWELYHDWGLIREKSKGAKAAQPLFEQGVQVVEAIVGSLPEEYRDRYLNQRMRKKLFEDWKHSQTMPLGRVTSRIRDFFRRQPGH